MEGRWRINSVKLHERRGGGGQSVDVNVSESQSFAQPICVLWDHDAKRGQAQQGVAGHVSLRLDRNETTETIRIAHPAKDWL
jgi:hypothetical protein